MAEASILVAQSQFICSICLDLLKNPVTIPCGHSYCMNCITDYWNYLLRVYSCPQCRQTFTPRPVLNKNVVMAEMVENLKMRSYVGPGDVECDVCTGRKYKAVKSCLVCLESYCQTHFERHEEFHSGRRHKVTDATGRLKEMICSKHDKQLEIFCRTDQCCICYLCTMDEHRNHDTVAAVMERTEKQGQLEDIQRKFQQKIQDRQDNLQELKKALGIHGHSVHTAVEYSQEDFVEPVYATEVTPVSRDWENNRGLLGELEQEIEDLKIREVELKQISITTDHIYFLQCFQSFVSFLETVDESINSSLPSHEVQKSVSELKEKLVRLGKEEEKSIFDRGVAAPAPFQRSQHPLPSLQAPPLRSNLPPPLPSSPPPPSPPPPLRTQHTPSFLDSPPAPPPRSYPPRPLPSLPTTPSPLRLQHPPTPPQSLQSPPAAPLRSFPATSPIRSQLLPLIPPSLRSQQPPTPPPKPLRLQFPLLPALRSQTSVESPPPQLPSSLRSQNSVESPPPQLPPSLRSQNSVESRPPLLPPLRSQNSVESPPPQLPPSLRSQSSVESRPPLLPPLRSQNSVESPPPQLPPSLRSQSSVESRPPLLPPLRSQNSVESPPPQLPPSLRSQSSVESRPPLLPPLRSQNSVDSPPPLPPPLRSQNSVDSPPPLPPPLRSQNPLQSPPPLPPPFR